ncbi:MAG TPA: urea transporter [Pseudolabrys sp.]|nr:urea transporter [Pseudolabrys sp.]
MVQLRLVSLALGNSFLIRSPWISALLWVAIARDLRYPIFAIAGIVVADIVGWGLGLGEAARREGTLRNNAIFASLAVAWLTTASGADLQTLIMVEVASATAASLIAAAVVRVLRDTILPPLGWGFYLAAGVLFTLFSSWTHSAYEATVMWPLPVGVLGWIESFLHSLGMLLFLPKIEVGIIVAIAIILWSRLMFVTGLVGWICGVGLGLLLERMGLNYLWLLAAHNYFVAGMLLGSVLFLPGRGILIVAMIAGMAASVLTAYFQYLFPGTAYAFLPVPATLTAWFGVGALLMRNHGGPLRQNMTGDVAPEMAWWMTALWLRRFGDREPLLVLPLAGRAVVTQGFDGPLSHVGRWRHALDFQRPPAATPFEPESTIWDSPVYAPGPGIIEAIRADVADNPIGITNFAEMWGNYVIIRLDAGGWALVAHLRQGTVAVAPGMRAEIGTYLARAGNSGRSPVPHLHLHAQVSPQVSASTQSFRLANYMTADGAVGAFSRWHGAEVPPVGTVVMAATFNPETHQAVTGMAPGKSLWRVEIEGTLPRAFRRYGPGAVVQLRVFLDETGRHVIRSMGGGTLITATDPDAWRLHDVKIVDCPLLKLLAFGAPSIPYAAVKGTWWSEPMPLPPDGPWGWLKLLTLPYLSQPFAMVRSVCVGTPDNQGGLLTVETRPDAASTDLPVKVTCTFERLRGPVKVEAEFASGRIAFSVVSFEPGLPFERRDRPRR